MPTYLVTHTRTGPLWDSGLPLEDQSDWAAHLAFITDLAERGVLVLAGLLAGGDEVVQVVEAESEDDASAIVAEDPWNETHYRLASVRQWLLRVDLRR
jgi:uncharacterized protein YciI